MASSFTEIVEKREDLTIEESAWRVYVLLALRWAGERRPGSDAEAVFWGAAELLCEGAHPEDYATVIRALCEQKNMEAR